METDQDVPTEYSKLEGFCSSVLFYRAFFTVERRMIMANGHGSRSRDAGTSDREFFISITYYRVDNWY